MSFHICSLAKDTSSGARRMISPYFLVELSFAFDEFPCQEIEHERQPRRGPKFRPWELRERVKVKVVNNLYGGILRPSMSVIHTVEWTSS